MRLDCRSRAPTPVHSIWLAVCRFGSVLVSAPEASWRRVFDPCTPLLFDLYYYLEQNGYFWLVPEHDPGPISQVLPGCWVRHPCYSKKLFVRTDGELEVAPLSLGSPRVTTL